MWIRKRIDIRAKDLIYALSYCMTSGSRTAVTRKIQMKWDNGSQKGFVCLSVRTGFDLLFQALRFQPGDEIIFSALTIPDMPKIVEAHGLVAVPTDLSPDSLGPMPDQLEAVITSRTKAIVVAHLFGGIIDLDGIAATAKKHGILVIEDCAQAYCSKSYSGSADADVSMFSFGSIKTATALGGAVLIVRKNEQLFRKMQELQLSYPIQPGSEFFRKTLKYILIVFLSSHHIYPLIVWLLKKRGIDYDSYIHTLSRSFPGNDFFTRIRQQASFPLLKLLDYRFETYPFQNIDARIEKGNYLLRNLPESFRFPGQQAFRQTYWAFPVLTTETQRVIAGLRAEGFDATTKNSLLIVGNNGDEAKKTLQNVQILQNQIVFLPIYPELPMEELNKMIGCLRKF